MKFSTRLVPLFVTLFCFTSGARAEVWTAVNTWNKSWEQSYSEWVAKNWTKDFFSRRTLPNGQSNPYYGVRADCADTVYSMRLIYSFENKLPFAFKDPTTLGKVITHGMKRWDHETDAHRRVKNYLNYVFDVVSTRSLPDDTYPVATNREHIRPGGLIRTTQVNHHSWTIKAIQAIGVPHLIFNSTVGAHSGSGLQERTSWPNPYWIFDGNFTPSGEAGFRDWRPLEYLNRPVWEVPGYSEEQYKIPLKQWQKTLQNRLALRLESDEQIMSRLASTACEALSARVIAINEGVQFLRSLPSRKCMDYATYDTYSTPNRDQRLFDDVAALRRTYQDILKTNNGNSLPEDMKTRMNKIFPFIQLTARQETERMTVSNLDGASWCPVEYAAGKKMDFAEAKRKLFLGRLSNNPMDDLEYRWGTLVGPSARAKSCPKWDPWQPDLRQAD